MARFGGGGSINLDGERGKVGKMVGNGEVVASPSEGRLKGLSFRAVGCSAQRGEGQK